MPLELVEDAMGDPRNAAFLAVAAELAYLNGEAGPAAFREQLGLEATLHSVGNTQAYVAHNADHIVAAFRGTESPTSLDGIKDWLLTNAVNLLVLPEGRLGTDFAAAGVDARFHSGFLTALAAIWDPVSEAVAAETKRKERPLWLTGHSLGGALAQLSAWLFNRKFVSVHQVYTYGAPMVGNAVAAEAFNKAFPDKIYRYIDTIDPVPKLPTISLIANDYLHCNREVGLNTALEEAATALALFKGLAGRAVDGVLNATLIDDLWEGVKGRLAAHGLDNYRKLVAERFGRS